MKKKLIQLLPFLGVFILYLAVRLPTVRSHSVAYTYDQGRDFIVAANVILLHKIPFIGPTTGINGLFHGSWWYYYLVLPFLIFKGLTIGFYYTNLLIHFLSLSILLWFLCKKTNYLLALFAGLFIVFSPYFIFTSLFVGNNIMVLPSLLLFLITNYFIFTEKKNNLYLYFINGLMLGFVAEFELSFGLFIIPTYLIAYFLFPQLRKLATNVRSVILGICGLFIAFLPRVLFELKNHFEQTKILLSFITKPKLYNPKPFNDILYDRTALFIGYWKGMFPNDYWCYFFSFALVVTLTYLLINKKKLSVYILFLTYLIVGLFLFSLTYKDNFWGNYYEGIQYIMTLFMIFIFAQINLKLKYIKPLFISLISIFFITQLIGLVQTGKKTASRDGLAIQEDVMNIILKKESAQKDFCLRIYTPPVIPYTYNYLFLYNKLKGKINIPSSEWINGTCWFIVESDSFQKRRDDWLGIHVPKDKYEVTTTKLKDVEVRYYKVLPK